MILVKHLDDSIHHNWSRSSKPYKKRKPRTSPHELPSDVLLCLCAKSRHVFCSMLLCTFRILLRLVAEGLTSIGTLLCFFSCEQSRRVLLTRPTCVSPDFLQVSLVRIRLGKNICDVLACTHPSEMFLSTHPSTHSHRSQSSFSATCLCRRSSDGRTPTSHQSPRTAARVVFLAANVGDRFFCARSRSAGNTSAPVHDLKRRSPSVLPRPQVLICTPAAS